MGLQVREVIASVLAERVRATVHVVFLRSSFLYLEGRRVRRYVTVVRNSFPSAGGSPCTRTCRSRLRGAEGCRRIPVIFGFRASSESPSQEQAQKMAQKRLAQSRAAPCCYRLLQVLFFSSICSVFRLRGRRSLSQLRAAAMLAMRVHVVPTCADDLRVAMQSLFVRRKKRPYTAPTCKISLNGRFIEKDALLHSHLL